LNQDLSGFEKEVLGFIQELMQVFKLKGGERAWKKRIAFILQ
jgi:hypothetical protein